jgi:hypothetical protein
MKVLKCHCGRVRVGVPRRQKSCSLACDRERLLKHLAAITAKRSARLRERVTGLDPFMADKYGYRRGWKQGHKVGYAEGFDAAMRELLRKRA